jgi:hypothetical protein
MTRKSQWGEACGYGGDHVPSDGMTLVKGRETRKQMRDGSPESLFKPSNTLASYV